MSATRSRGRDVQGLPFYEISVVAPFELARRLADILSEAGHPSASATGLFETPDKAWRAFAHYAERPDPEALRVLFEICGAGKPPESQIVEQRDWVALSRTQLAPIEAGRFCVHGGHDRQKARGRPNAIEIDAGQAFGTAHHATTRACLLILDGILKFVAPRTVLDLGTGSGILAIATAKTCRAHVFATDIDPVAIRVARENTRLNRVPGRVRLAVAEGMAHPELRKARFDLVFANILAGPLYRLAPALARAVLPGGHLILSGVTVDQSRATEARYRGLGFIVVRRRLLQDWAALHLRRRAD